MKSGNAAHSSAQLCQIRGRLTCATLALLSARPEQARGAEPLAAPPLHSPGARAEGSAPSETDEEMLETAGSLVASPNDIPPSRAPSGEHWYGLPMILGDTLFWSVALLGHSTQSSAVEAAGLAAGITHGLVAHTIW